MEPSEGLWQEFKDMLVNGCILPALHMYQFEMQCEECVAIFMAKLAVMEMELEGMQGMMVDCDKKLTEAAELTEIYA